MLTDTLSHLSSDLITTNRPPADEELACARKMANIYEARLEGVQRQISDMEISLRKLQQEQSVILRDLAPFQRVLSPIRRLPHEILCAIFEACVDPNSNPTMSSTEAPVLLTRITSDLRTIAIATPSLWSAIHVTVFRFCDQHESELAMSILGARKRGLEEWLLRRSRELPLRISIKEVGEVYFPFSLSPQIQEIMDVILSCRSRWRDIQISLDVDDKLLASLASIAPEQVPYLRAIKLSPSSHSYLPDKVAIIQLLSTPGLQKLGSFPIQWLASPSTPVCLSNLTHLVCRGVVPRTGTYQDVFAFSRALRQCQALICLSFWICIILEDELHEEEIELPNLLRLEVYEDFRSGHLDYQLQTPVSSLVRVFNAPLLESLSYNWEGGVYLKLLIPFLKRSQNLRRLSVGYCPDISSLVDGLYHLPALNCLGVQELGASLHYIQGPGLKSCDYFLLRCSETDVSKVICPQLQYFKSESPLHISYMGSIKKFVLNKSGSTPGLLRWIRLAATIDFLAPEAGRSGIESLMRKLDEAGLRLDLTFAERTTRLASRMMINAENNKCGPLWPSPSYPKDLVY